MELFVYYLIILIQPGILILGFGIIIALHLHHRRGADFSSNDWGSGGIPIPVEPITPDKPPVQKPILF
ncbi:MAG: hypothetical protein AAFR59_12270 [Bacteroidota bacterium]